MKQLFCLALAACLLMCACAQPDQSATTEPVTSQPTGSVTTGTTQVTETTQATEAPTEAPTEPVLLYTNPLTGKPQAEPMTNRPFTVMFNNTKAAMPLQGVSQADIVYEILSEGNITRYMGIFSNIEAVEALGSLRSARKYFVDITQSYDGILLHAGGSNEAYAYMNSIRCDHIDGVNGAYAENYYYRDQDRLNAGYAREHTMFITGPKAVEYAANRKCTLARNQEISYGLHFDDQTVIIGSAANKVKICFNTGSQVYSSTKTTTMTYNAADGLYYGYQHGSDMVDGNTNKPVAFKNVLILKAKTSTQYDSTLRTIEVTGSGEGYFVCNGQIVPIRWSRESLYQPFVYTLENGSPLTLGVGTSYIAVIPTPGLVEYE